MKIIKKIVLLTLAIGYSTCDLSAMKVQRSFNQDDYVFMNGSWVKKPTEAPKPIEVPLSSSESSSDEFSYKSSSDSDSESYSQISEGELDALEDPCCCNQKLVKKMAQKVANVLSYGPRGLNAIITPLESLLPTPARYFLRGASLATLPVCLNVATGLCYASAEQICPAPTWAIWAIFAAGAAYGTHNACKIVSACSSCNS